MSDLQLQEYSKKHTAAGTQIVVAAYPNNTNSRYVIDYIEAGGSAAGDLQILDDTNTAVDGYFFSWGIGGQVQVSGVALKKIPINRGIRYTTANGGNHNVIIKYHLEQLNYNA